MAESRTYRRVPQDLKEVTLINRLIDKHVAENAGTLATQDVAELRDLLNTQARWHDILADLQVDQSDTEGAPRTSAAPPSAVVQPDMAPKEVKNEPRTPRTATVKTNA